MDDQINVLVYNSNSTPLNYKFVCVCVRIKALKTTNI